MIQNMQSQLAQACCSLKSQKRWVVTGTPIQNKLTDLASLMKFLQVYPYSNEHLFDEDISKPWRKGDPIGWLRLKTLIRSIVLSRSRAIMHLSSRRDVLYHLEFSPLEFLHYEAAKKKTVEILRQAISKSNSTYVFNALQLFNVLRLICNHGLLAGKLEQGETLSARIDRNEPPLIEEAPDETRSTELAELHLCSRCSAPILHAKPHPLGSYDSTEPATSSNGNEGDGLCIQCSCDNSILALEPVTSSDVLEEIERPQTPVINSDICLENLPTKIKALVEDLIAHEGSEKMHVSAI